MNVTYLIGNGFDLGMGLKTSFTNFLTYYVETPSSSKIIETFKSTIKSETIELWSDFEVSFGKYISNFAEKTIDDYISLYEDVLAELNKYLITENSRFPNDIDENQYKKIVSWLRLGDLNKIGFRPSVRDRFLNLTNYNHSLVSVIYDFLSFNYTNTLDKIINKIHDLNKGVLYSQSYFMVRQLAK